MNQRMLRRWLGSGVLSGLLVTGCNHAQRQCCTTPVASYSVTSADTYAGMTTPALKPVPPQAPVVRDEPRPTELPAPTVTAEAAPAPPPEPAPRPAQEIESTSYAPPAMTVREDPVRRRSFADISVRSCFAHAPDYSWLCGELQLLHPSNEWRLRYAGVDDDDPYGGGVTLTETGPMDAYKSGDCVRVEGNLVDPESRTGSATFRVRSMTRVDNP
jgi:hypothetical protein